MYLAALFCGSSNSSRMSLSILSDHMAILTFKVISYCCTMTEKRYEKGFPPAPFPPSMFQ